MQALLPLLIYEYTSLYAIIISESVYHFTVRVRESHSSCQSHAPAYLYHCPAPEPLARSAPVPVRMAAYTRTADERLQQRRCEFSLHRLTSAVECVLYCARSSLREGYRLSEASRHRRQKAYLSQSGVLNMWSLCPHAPSLSAIAHQVE